MNMITLHSHSTFIAFLYMVPPYKIVTTSKNTFSFGNKLLSICYSFYRQYLKYIKYLMLNELYQMIYKFTILMI